MKSDKSIAVLAMVASLILAVGAASAQELSSNPEEASVDEANTLSEFASQTTDSQSLYGGNVTNANISGEQTTDEWAGIYGTATGSLVLGTYDGSNEQVFYEWGGAEVNNVFAYSFADGINWANLSVGNASNVSDAYTIDSSGADNAASTYNTSTTVNIETQSYTVDAANTNSNVSGDDFTTGILQDVENESAPVNDQTEQTNDPIFAGSVKTGSTGAFNGDPADYQMIVPAEEAGTDYSLYVELS